MSNTMQRSDFDAYTFLREETNEKEIVQPEKWRWVAIYNDNTIIHQFDHEGIFHQLKEVDQAQLNIFRMMNAETGQTIDIDWHPARKLIHFYRNMILENGTVRYRLYVFGYETQIAGTTHKVLMVILPDDRMVITENVNNIKLK